MKDFKYLFAYTAPLAIGIALSFGGIWSFSGFILAFMIIPTMELIWKGTTYNLTDDEETVQNNKLIFDILLYLNVPLVYGFLAYYFYILTTGVHTWWEILGYTLSIGILLGADGINVAHELGHRNTWYERLMAKMLLLPNLYLHFIIEHNYGHHKWVSTDKDPASSRLNEPIYTFYFRSVIGSYLSAWKISANHTEKKGHHPYHLWFNPMFSYQFVQILYLALVYFFFGWQILLLTIAAAIIGFLLLESVNYIEHYGLRRKKLANGRYEPVQSHHSWNSNHDLGRIFLYELTRHSDHHYKANRKYQVLRHFDESPQLPLGYPASILMALIPPLWFAYMNPKVAFYTGEHFENSLKQKQALA